MLNKDILDVIACPKCKSSLQLSKDETFLICKKCSVKYPIEDGIPELLIEKAIPIKEEL
jgi:uncharacterized protein YbaR (Trm112 family)